jgi:hypothetical protein
MLTERILFMGINHSKHSNLIEIILNCDGYERKDVGDKNKQ